MNRRLVTVFSAALLVGLGLVNGDPAAARPKPPPVPSADSELSVTTRLADRREVAAGTRAYSLGFEDGRFYANGWHITGEMGGVWTPPVKLVDGVWFGLDDQWVGPATKFTSGWGYTRFDLPTTSGLRLSRTDFVPDGPRGALFGLTISNPGGARTAKLTVNHALRTDGPISVGVHRRNPPTPATTSPDKGSYDGQRVDLHRRRCAARCADPPLRRSGGHRPKANGRFDRAAVLGPAARPSLHRHRARCAGRTQAL